MASLNFSAQNVAPSTGYAEPIPAGWYAAKITESEVKPTTNGTGLRLNLTFEILGGQFNGRKVFNGLNIRNASEKTQQIAEADLSAICHAVGVLNLQDSALLHNIPMKVRVKIKPASGDYDARNELQGYRHINDPSVQVSGEPQQMAAPVMQPQAPVMQQPQPQQMQQPQAPVQQQQTPIPAASPQQMQGEQPNWMAQAGQQPWTQPQPQAQPQQTQPQQQVPVWAQPQQ